MRDTYTDLERRFDGFIPQDEIDRADGLDPALIEARGRVRFWRERLANALDALRSWQASTRTDVDVTAQIAARRRDYLSALGSFKRAAARLRLLRHPETAGIASLLGSLNP
mgnify:CR=1 FL=1